MKPQTCPVPDKAPTPEAHDASLLRGLANGDRHCCQELLRRHRDRLFGVAFSVLHSREDAEDTLQDVMAQTWRKAASFEPTRASVATWLTALTRNRAIDRLRHRQRQSRLNEAYQAHAEDTQLQPSMEGSDRAEVFLRDESAALRQALSLLGHDQRQAIELAFFADLTQQEIADHLDTPLGTIKARIRRGLQKLSRLVSPRLGRN